ncbi:Lrp/AsnC family transcriptional regulator [Halobaculum sp. MBLA0143]|uniref:Lrp/AsnC family transcriptional regulator n=1 Tax=Halobaculum sp. MBLA0143 TaxID=3079933 RepID=UPI0035250A24
MVKANTGEADRVKSALADTDDVVEAHIVAGDVDFVVKVTTDSPGDVKRVVAGDVRSLEGVERTQTYIAMDD